MSHLLVVPGPGEALMIVFGLLLCFFAVRKKYEPLLLLPIGLGIVLVNLPISPMRRKARSSGSSTMWGSGTSCSLS